MRSIPTTNLHKLSAERVAKVAKKIIKRLVRTGVLPPSAALPKPPLPEAPRAERFNGILDCRPPSRYFVVIDGGKSGSQLDIVPAAPDSDPKPPKG